MSEDRPPEERQAQAEAVRRKHQAALLRLPNVMGVGIGYRKRRGNATREIALIVLVTRKVPRVQLAPADRIPGEIEGVPVDVQEAGEVTPQA